ncbi:MAG: DUF748 domain-containing protein [Steroidobacteraceae bacterium]
MTLRGVLRKVGRRWLITIAALGLLFLGYLWAGYVLAPRLIRTYATRWAQSHPGVTLALGRIAVDPLHFTVSVRDIDLRAAGQPLIGMDRLFVGLAPLSLIAGVYHVTTLDLETPRIHVAIGANGAVNLAALATPASAKPAHPAPSGAPPQIRIDDLRIDSGQLTLSDRGRSPVARETLVPITLRLVHFKSWGRTGGQFALKANTTDGAQIAWWGQVSMTPLASCGAVALAAAPLRDLARFLPAGLPLVPRAGQLGINAQYSLGEGPRGLGLSVSNLDLVLHALALEGGAQLHGTVRIASLRATGGTLSVQPGSSPGASLARLAVTDVRLLGSAAASGQNLSLQHLVLSDTRLDLAQHQIALGSLALRGLQLPVDREPDGQLALLRWLPGGKPASPPTPAAPGAPGSPAAKWQVGLARFELRDATVAVHDLAVRPAAQFIVRLYSLTARALSTDLERSVPFTLRAGLAPRAYLLVNGRLTPARKSAAVWLSLARLPLQPFVPYAPLAPTAEVHSGIFAAHLFADLEDGRLARLDGQLDLRDLSLLDRADGTGLFGWQRLSVRGIAYRPSHLTIADAQLLAPTGLIVILPNRTLNLAALASPHAAVAPAGKPAHTPRAPLAAPRKAPAFAALLKRLQIVNGSITFADESIEPHFRAPIDDLHGTIENLSTDKAAIARVALAGQVIDRYSPVTISGSFNPYGLGSQTDIRAAFDNIQLPVFNPYSDRYAGYAIAKGILSAHFRYRIENRKLNADHLVVVNHLDWGGASPSKQRVGWPIRLATALLKDRNGVIRIHLPVTGSLDNPDFHIASIVWTMLVHLLEKAALAPFNLIGKLFAGAAQAQYIEFQPGSAALSHAAAASLAALSKGLASRPALQVDIPAGPAGPQDAVAIENLRIEALALAHLRRPPPGGFGALSIAQQLRELTALYRARIGKRPRFPPDLPLEPTAPAATGAVHPGAPPPPDKRLERERSELHWLREQLRPSVRPEPGTLAALGLARAQAVQDAMLAHGALGPKRVFLTTQEAGEPWNGHIRLKLRLK